MTPVALWTGRLPGLRPLPRKRTLWLVGVVVALGTVGALGLLGPDGPWLGLPASFLAFWIVWRHRWPTRAPIRLRPHESPQGPDERSVIVEFRHEGDLLGWDVGILWFERGGVGFVGRTVSFVLPRAIMVGTPDSSSWGTTLRAPQMTAKVLEVTVCITPLAREANAQMTLARIDALPDEITSETILPPSSLHPDLLHRSLVVRRRLSLLYAMVAIGASCLFLPAALDVVLPGKLYGGLRALLMLGFVLCSLMGYVPLPSSIRARLPQEPRKRINFL